MTTEEIMRATAIALTMNPWRADSGSPFSFTVNVGETKTYGFLLMLGLWESEPESATVYWGDGTSDFYTQSIQSYGRREHTYTDEGVYTIKIVSQHISGIAFTGSETTSDDRIALISINTPFSYDVSLIYGFSNCTSLIFVHPNFFQHCIPTSVVNLFMGCASLRRISKRLIEPLQQAESVKGIFKDCTALTYIENGLFENFEATDFSEAFWGCESLEEIPADLFSGCGEVTTFERCFNKCTAVTSIPEHLFDDCIEARNFKICFGLSGVSNVPSGLFSQNVNAQLFSNCFASCANLEEIGAHLFDITGSTVSYLDLSYCFNNCTSLASIGSDFYLSTFTNGNFSHIFDGDAAITTDVPDLWNVPNVSSYSYAFRGCVNAANYASIPSGWK